MRRLLAASFVVLATTLLYAAEAENIKVEVKGPHICCPQCSKVVGTILKKVDGVSDIKADQKNKTVTFTAKDDKAVTAGYMALVKGGFYGSVTVDGKKLGFTERSEDGAKADVVTVKDVHVCCGACQKAINKLFSDSKVSYTGKGPQKTVRIEGKDLTRREVMESLHKTGFNGTVEN